LPEDRAAKERRVRELFGKDANRRSGSVIAVATQVIEVGLDISAQALHTELAPANSVLQRAGRCARFQGETGEVFAYAPENALPYQGQEAVMARTSEWLLAHQGERVDFQGEQSLVDWAHAEADRDLFDGLRATRRRHGERMRAALNGDRASAGELIRKIAAQQLTISAQPDLLSAKPFEAPLFSLHPGSIESAAKRWLAAEPEGFEVQERIWRLIEADEGDEYDARYGWSPIRHPKEVIGASLIAVHPDLAAYDADEGLSLKRGGRFRAEAWMCRQSTGAGKAREPKFYRLESYQEHRRLVLGSHLAAWRELASAAGRLEARAGWPKGQLALAAAMVAALHDAGKLTVAWQSWVSDWQSSIGRPLPNGFLAAHTDYDEGLPAHVELQRQMRKRPPHAVEGAVVVARVLALALAKERRLLRATFSAIARHHGPFASGFSAYRIRADAPAILLSGLPAPPGGPAAAGAALRLKAEPASTAIDSLLVDGSDGDELLAYMLLARALRLADQEGTRLGSVGA
jgi:CRISPR-associated endonuclease/helicase Cas3